MIHLFRIFIVFNGINPSQPESDSLNSELLTDGWGLMMMVYDIWGHESIGNHIVSSVVGYRPPL